MDPLLELVDGIYEAAIRPEHWDSVFEKLCGYIAARSGCILVEDHDLKTRYILAAAGIPTLVRLSYRMGLAKYDPIYKLQAARPVGRADMVARHEEMKSENPLFYRFIMKPNDMGYLAAINLFNDDEWHVGIGVHRSFSASPFGDEELRLLEKLTPHIQRSLRIRRELYRQKSRSDSLHGALGKLLLGVVALDANRKIVYRNAAAEAITRKHPALRLDDDIPRAHFPTEQNQLDTLIAMALSGDASLSTNPNQATGLRHPDREHPLVVMATPSRAATADTVFHAERGELLLFISDPETAFSMPADTLHSLYGLTPAEAKVAILLANGLSSGEIASQNGASLETVRSQLKSIFRKMDVRNQQDVIRVLTRLGTATPTDSP